MISLDEYFAMSQDQQSAAIAGLTREEKNELFQALYRLLTPAQKKEVDDLIDQLYAKEQDEAAAV